MLYNVLKTKIVFMIRKTEIRIDSSGSYYEVKSNGLFQNGANGTGGRKLEQAQISLNDCLACRCVHCLIPFHAKLY